MNFSKYIVTFKKQIKAIIHLALGKKSIYYKGLKKYDLIIYDDIFPHPVSGFRTEEYEVLLKSFPNSKLITIPSAYKIVKTPQELHKVHIARFSKEHPSIKHKITVQKRFNSINAKLFYCVFLNNIFKFVELLEKKNIRFAFTLYPGGGFQMNDSNSDANLKRVLSSPMFEKVLVTQKVTRDYLLKNNFCSEDKIEFIFGGVVPQKSLIKNLSNKKYYSKEKTTLDICFCAGKYMPKGLDKGYDVFIELAHLLHEKYSFINFHIIGGFDETDIDVSKIKQNTTFYGYQKFEDLEKIFNTIDIIISPNKPFLLGKGAFDGFPLGTVVEAALNGVLVLLSDSLQQNDTFVDKTEVIIIENNSDRIEKIISDLIQNPEQISKIAKKGTVKFQEVYSNDFQMKPRIELLKNCISKS
ncbi:glycosyltransferase [Flavobacterium sp. SUN052]|uniref:glycosyltransferase n=1 Tax=Flavobacterium sp. SUN052 TaxID=3002441 RepID=UPI00237D6C43|nr:glycosyltransferase [Flavobacterium sp. SUN052]MEC4004435.1 glycosyltransferase [Flavobacterium sp. SUN052]